jgi:hypothetical protein
MFEPNSRYYYIEDAEYVAPDGRLIPYKRRRFLPHSDEMPLLLEVTVTQGDRLDLIADRTFRDPEHFWRICDANNAMNPFDLISEVGRRLRVPVPQVEMQ